MTTLQAQEQETPSPSPSPASGSFSPSTGTFSPASGGLIEESTPVETEGTTTVADDLPEEDNINDLQGDPLMSLIMFGFGLYVLKLWFEDTTNALKGNPHPKAFPGTSFCERPMLVLAAVGSLALVIVATIGEIALGVSADQHDATWVMLLGWMGMAVVEELLVRGYGGKMFIKTDNRKQMWRGILLISAAFAAMHPYLWTVDVPEHIPSFQIWRGTWEFHLLSIQKWWTTLMLFANSLFWFWLRYHKNNPSQSLLPCIVGHVSANVAVFMVKLMQGHIVGVWD